MLVTFELLEVEQSYIPLLKALMCGIDAVEAQGCGCMFTFCHAYLKMGVLLHKMAIVCKRRAMTVKPKNETNQILTRTLHTSSHLTVIVVGPSVLVECLLN